jgi:ligand-binding sensor domain-containing protein
MRRLLRKLGWTVGATLSLTLIVVIHGSDAWALGHEVKDLYHTAWTSESGLGAVFDIQQAPNGYLWLTTSKGVLRFDGVRFQSVEDATHGAVRNDDIFSVFLSSSGGVWLATRSAGFLLWKDGRLTAFPDRRCSPTAQIGGVAEDHDGSLWIQGAAGLFHLRGSVCEKLGKEQGYPGGFVAGILVDRQGTVWAKAASGGLLFLPRGQSKFQRADYSADPSPGVAYLHQGPDGSIWLSDNEGLRRVTNESGVSVISHLRRQRHKGKVTFRDFTFTPDDSLWAATDEGVERLTHVSQLHASVIDGTSSGEIFTPRQGLSSNAVWKVLTDREGSLWVATNSGLDRFRRTPLSALILPNSEEHEFGIAAGDDGYLWTGNSSRPLTHITSDGGVTSFPETGQVICIRRDRYGTIWSAGRGGFHLWRSSATGFGTKFSPVPYPDEKVATVVSLAVDRNKDPWISMPGNGTYQRVQGKWVNQNKILGKTPRVLGAMTDDAEGNVWFGFSNKLVRWDGSSYQRYSFPDGPLNVSVGTMAVRGDHVWLAGRGGVDLFTHGHFYLMRWKDHDLPGRVSGIVETKTGDLWINGFSGITHVSVGELTRWLKDPGSEVSAEHLDALDGLPGLSAERLPEPSVVESSDGRLWFATTQGVAWLDPATLKQRYNRIPPPVMIDSVIINGKRYAESDDLVLPKHTQSLEIDYTALSLAVPERVLFRYKLDGVDKDWQNAGTRRQAFYNSLSPGHYRFHVIACNNDGVWNRSGADLGFAIAPAFYQTRWFMALCVLVAGAILWWLVRLRIHSITRQLKGRLAERLHERERIARELHDTLLQSLFGLMLRFQTTVDRMAANDPARAALDEALNQSEAVMQEGRERVRNLRSSHLEGANLTDALAELGHQLQLIHPAEFKVSVEGRPRPLDPLIQEEILLVTREALTNAFTHSNAATIMAEVSYGLAALRVSIRDDGRGIEDGVLKTGSRSGHWGLPGMCERARKMRGQLHLACPKEGGTQIDLQIPAAVAYRTEHRASRSIWNPFQRHRRKVSEFTADGDVVSDEPPLYPTSHS